MDPVSYQIDGGDYDGAGAASRQVKAQLKRLGADGDAIRRAMIAAYEAEMNVVIHAHHGRLEASFADDHVDIAVIDEGPGIADIDKALTEGWSTASAEARALGFGAGLGLPNIRRNSDSFAISSVVDEGTRVAFTIRLRPEPATVAAVASLALHGELCKQCLRCLDACPTAALRVRDGGPQLIERLCIDCTACIGVCEPGALALAETAADVAEIAGGTLAVPPAFLAGFGERAPIERVTAALADAGFEAILTVDGCEAALRARAHEAAGRRELAWPVIAPLCPAALELIELRFPSLLDHVLPAATPWEALWDETASAASCACVVSCPAQRSALVARGAAPGRLAEPHLLRDVLLPVLIADGHEPVELEPRQAEPAGDGALRVTGARHVIAVLERIEDGLLTGVPVVELFTCEGGCPGSPLLVEDHHLSGAVWAARAAGLPSPQATAERRAPLSPRPGIRLDDDMTRAIAKLAELDGVRRSLPGRDCGACGAPTCAALAEDVVFGRAGIDLCPYLPQDLEAPDEA